MAVAAVGWGARKVSPVDALSLDASGLFRRQRYFIVYLAGNAVMAQNHSGRVIFAGYGNVEESAFHIEIAMFRSEVLLFPAAGVFIARGAGAELKTRGNLPFGFPFSARFGVFLLHAPL